VQGHSAHGKCPAVKTVPGKVRIKAVGNTLSPDMTCCCEDTHVRYPTPQNQSTEHPFCFVGNKMEKDTMLYITIPAKYILKGNE